MTEDDMLEGLLPTGAAPLHVDSFSCTLLVTEEPGSAIAAHSLVLLDPRRFVGQCKYLPF